MRTPDGALTIEHDRLPIVDIVYAGKPSFADMQAAFEEYARIAERGELLVWLADMRRFDPLQVTAADRRQTAALFQQHAPRLRRVSVAEARVITSPVTRGIVTAFDWLTAANKWPCQQFGTIEQAEVWLRAKLERA